MPIEIARGRTHGALLTPDAEFSKMLDAQYFITHGGQKGLQLSVLKPGTYPINTALFQVKVGFKDGKTQQVWDKSGLHEYKDSSVDTSISVVPAGDVGVVRSSGQERGKDCPGITVALDGRRAGVDVKEIRLGESAIPPELLLARQREQLALLDEPRKVATLQPPTFAFRSCRIPWSHVAEAVIGAAASGRIRWLMRGCALLGRIGGRHPVRDIVALSCSQSILDQGRFICGAGA